MFRSQLPRAARLQSATSTRFYRPQAFRRLFTSGSKNEPSLEAKRQSRILAKIDVWITRLPTSLQPPLVTLRNSPASYVVAFGILHEITAVVPIFVLVGVFHYTRWLPAWFAEGKMIVASVEAIGKWFKRRGWIDADDEAEVEKKVREGEARMFEKQRRAVSKIWDKGERASRLLVELATAYTIVKVLLPFRLVLSAFWAPGFARLVVIPVVQKTTTGWSALRAWLKLWRRRGDR